LIDRRNYHLFQPLLNQVATGLLSPPLRERREDIPLLIRFFTQRYVREMNRVIEEIPAAPLEALIRYTWPGNIHDLQNLVERSVILSPVPVLHIVVPDAVPDSDWGPRGRCRDAAVEAHDTSIPHQEGAHHAAFSLR
jgi:DNA-binding NtrC family response regulator